MRISVGYIAIAFWAALFASSEARAQDLGKVGPLYLVAEPDLLARMEARAREQAASGEWERRMAGLRERSRQYAERPPGRRLPRTTEHRIRPFDPTLVVPYAIRDGEGRVLYPAGIAVNPLDYMPMTSRIAFFDGDDPAQRAWARRVLQGPYRITPVLVNGPVGALMAEWGIPLYFDQRGYLIEHFGIERLPSLVYQDGRRLAIEETPLEEAGG